jgi:hypothetical protein
MIFSLALTPLLDISMMALVPLLFWLFCRLSLVGDGEGDSFG